MKISISCVDKIAKEAINLKNGEGSVKKLEFLKNISQQLYQTGLQSWSESTIINALWRETFSYPFIQASSPMIKLN